MAKPFRFWCDGCNILHDDGTNYARCAYCAGQHLNLMKLRTRIVSERPHLGKLSPTALFTKLYETLKEKEKCR